MKPKSLITCILGLILAIGGIIILILSGNFIGSIPALIGGSLFYLGWKGGQVAMLIFGHSTIVVGCYLITWGIYLLPHSKPTPAGILCFPLFWGLITLLGGICANYHGFCNCILKKDNVKNR